MDENVKKCEACGTVARPEDVFCLSCGTKLEAPEAAATEPPVMEEVEVPAAPPADGMTAAAYGETATPYQVDPPWNGQPVAEQPGGYVPPAAGVWQQPQATPGFMPPQAQAGQQQPGQPAYGQPQPGQPPYGQPQPGQPPYGQPQPGQPPYGQPQQQGYPPAPYGGYGMPPVNAPKKKSALPVVIVCVVVAVLALLILGLFFLFGNSAKKDYEVLREGVVSSVSMDDAAGYEADLEQFVSANPKYDVDSDLESLVAASVAYTEADPDDEYRYTDAMMELEFLEDSAVPGLGECATSLIPEVEADYEEYQARVAKEESASATEGDATADEGSTDMLPYDPASSPMPVAGEGLGVLDEIDGDPVFSFEATNETDKTIDYFEVIAFFYDENGEPLVGEDGQTWSYKVDDSTLAPGAVHRPAVEGYWPAENHPNAAYVVPIVVYTTFEDGAFWGEIILFEPDDEFVAGLQQEADAIMASAQ